VPTRIYVAEWPSSTGLWCHSSIRARPRVCTTISNRKKKSPRRSRYGPQGHMWLNVNLNWPMEWGTHAPHSVGPEWVACTPEIRFFAIFFSVKWVETASNDLRSLATVLRHFSSNYDAKNAKKGQKWQNCLTHTHSTHTPTHTPTHTHTHHPHPQGAESGSIVLQLNIWSLILCSSAKCLERVNKL